MKEMDEITLASEYRAKQRKIVTLPSGFTFEIRKMSPLVFAKMFDVLGYEANVSKEQTESIIKEKLEEILKLIIPNCVVKPKISLEPTDDEEVLCLEDLEMDDFYTLLDEISNFSGLSEDDMKERELFRKK